MLWSVDCGAFSIVFLRSFLPGYLDMILVLISFPSIRWLVLQKDSSAQDSLSVYYCVKTSNLGNVCFIDCQDNFDALQLPACDLCLRFYEIVLSSGFILPIRPCWLV